jgi:hypothetical protein
MKQIKTEQNTWSFIRYAVLSYEAPVEIKSLKL